MKSLLGVILIGLVIFSYAEVCKAECAWVLWQKYCRYSDDMWCSWEVQAAYPALDQCTKAKEHLCKSKKSYMKGNCLNPKTELGVDYLSMKIDEKNWASIELLCLPDTIDPRK